MNRITAPLQPALKFLKVIFTPVALGFLVFFAWHSRDLLWDLFTGPKLFLMLISVALWFSLHFIFPLFTVLSLRGCQQDVHYLQMFIIHTNRLPAKYIPGGLWHAAARTADYHRLMEIAPRHIGAYLLLENGIIAAVTLAMGGFVVWGGTEESALHTLVALLATGGIIVLIALPLLINRYILAPTGQTIQVKAYISSMVVVVFFWLLAATSFLFYLQSFPEVAIGLSWLKIGGIYIFSWGVGFISIFAPQGIGVAELVSSYLMDSSMGVTSFAVFLAGFRIVILVGDIAAWGVSLILRQVVKNVVDG